MNHRTIMRASILLLAAVGASIPFELMAQARPDLMYCGTSSRTGSNLYLGVTLNEVQGCTPGSSTQAMLVERSGTISGNGAAWLNYLDNGGIIITEFNNSHVVYNEIYGTNYARGRRYGNCLDNAMPSLIINPGSQFWINNPITPTAPNVTSCGYELENILLGEPSVVPLGGDIATGWTTFACRQQGSGTLHLLDHDWQDNEQSYTNDSRNFMGVLITTTCDGSGGQEEYVPVPTLSQLAMIVLALGLAWFGGRRFLADSRS